MRSLLFVPADSERKLTKALTAGADAIIIDLEDSVAPDNKTAGRTITASFLAGIDKNANSETPQIYVRINPLDGEYWRHDLDAVMPQQPDGIMQPKARSGADVDELAAALTSGDTDRHTKLIVLVTELPQALLRMQSFVDCDPQNLAGFTWGGEDLSAELGAISNRDESGVYTHPYQLARSLCLITSAAQGIQAIDSVYTDFHDHEGLAIETRAAKRDGFTGKLAIHPAQVPVINQIMTPSSKEMTRAKAIVAAFDAAPGVGVVALDGKMLDRPHLLAARRILKAAKAYRK